MKLEKNMLVDEIVCQTIALLSEQKEFDEMDLERIEQLLRSKEATRSENVVRVVSAQEECAT